MVFPRQPLGQTHGVKRRSTRLREAVPVGLLGEDASGQPIREQTATFTINCHGCRFFTRHNLQKNAWLTLEIPGGASGGLPQRLRGRVAWTQRSLRLRGLFQVGVEFEAPGNVWGIVNPPEDWQPAAAPNGSDPAALEKEMQRRLRVAESGNYYQLLDVTAMATRAEIKRHYYDLARAFHPDHHMDRPQWAGELHRLMDVVALAYKTLSDDNLRQDYDRRLAESGAFALRETKTEAQKTGGECLEKARECLRAHNFAGSIIWLRKAVEIEPGSPKFQALLARSLSVIPQYRREAVEHFERALELDPINIFAHFHFGKYYEESKLPWRARPHYVKILELEPHHAAARERLRAIDSDKKNGKSAHDHASFLNRLLHRNSK